MSPSEWWWWLSIPVVALVGALVWVAWSSRPAQPPDVSASVEEFRRFRQAVAQASRPDDPKH